MIVDVEISNLDLRHVDLKIANATKEYALMESIAAYGQQDPLCGVKVDDSMYILLDGFKRQRAMNCINYRCIRLECLGDGDESTAILTLVRQGLNKAMNILEQCAFINYLITNRKFTLGQIASHLAVSKAWVSIRKSMHEELSTIARNKIFSGKFPAYSYLYTLRPFMRLNEYAVSEVDEFINAVSGKCLSTREISKLAYGYFKGNEFFRELIQQGKILDALKRSERLLNYQSARLSELECNVINDLDIMNSVIIRLNEAFANYTRFKSASFFAQSNLLAQRSLELLDPFISNLRTFHDRSRIG